MYKTISQPHSETSMHTRKESAKIIGQGDKAETHIPRVSDFDFMTIINLRIRMEFDRENHVALTLHPQSQSNPLCYKFSN